MPTLDFKGKQHIYAHHLTVLYRPLVPDAERSLNADGADDNLIIHGDNLHALKALLPRYAGRVKCIYIDPPYSIMLKCHVLYDRRYPVGVPRCINFLEWGLFLSTDI